MVRKEERRTKNEWTLKKITFIFGLITSVILIGQTINSNKKNNLEKSVKIYDSKLLKVDELNIIDPNLNNVKKDEEDFVYLAVKNQILINNKTDSNLLVDQLDIQFLESSKFYYSDVLLLQGIKDERLIFYMVNNGNIDSGEQRFKLKISLTENFDGKYKTNDLYDEKINQIIQEETDKSINLQGGEIKKVYEFNLGEELHKYFEENPKLMGLNFSLSEDNSKKEFRVYSVFYDRANKKFTYNGLGMAGGGKNYKIINVSPEMEKKITVDEIDTYVDSNSMGTVDVIFLAKESVSLKFKNTIKIKGKSIEDEKIKNINIAVPVYDITSDLPNQEIFNLLCEYGLSEYKYNEVIRVEDSIRYNPNKVLKIIKENE